LEFVLGLDNAVRLGKRMKVFFWNLRGGSNDGKDGGKQCRRLQDTVSWCIKNLRVSSQELNDDLEAIKHRFLLRGFSKKEEE
jgi:hypothetical protein